MKTPEWVLAVFALEGFNCNLYSNGHASAHRAAYTLQVLSTSRNICRRKTKTASQPPQAHFLFDMFVHTTWGPRTREVLLHGN